MKSVKTPSTNATVSGPGLHDLHMTHMRFPDGTPVMLTVWQPSRKELEMLLHEATVQLQMIGVAMPPVHIGVAGLDYSRSVEGEDLVGVTPRERCRGGVTP